MKNENVTNALLQNNQSLSASNTCTYLDNAATTAVYPEAIARMNEILMECNGNSSSGHLKGREALALFEDSMKTIASSLQTKSDNVIFTSGGSESNNQAIWAGLGGLTKVVKNLLNHTPQTMASTRIEHLATKKLVEELGVLGLNVYWLPLRQSGLVDVEQFEFDLKNGLRIDLLSVHHAQNEMGTLQDVQVLSCLLKKYQPAAKLHVDAVQSYLKAGFDFGKFPLVDYVSISAHKIGGPKGAGVLALSPRLGIEEFRGILLGSSQQHGARPGTIPVALACATATAVAIGAQHFDRDRQQLKELREYLEQRLVAQFGRDLTVHGPREERYRAPQTLFFSLRGLVSYDAILALSERGICVSAGSACSSTKADSRLLPNAVLKELKFDEALSTSVLRVSLSHSNTKADLETFIQALVALR